MESNENKSINDFDFSLICEYFSSLRRQGPGSDEATLQALSFLPGLSNGAKIADLGCGSGSSTLLLAQHTEARITALDIFPDFIEVLKANAANLGLAHKINPLVGSMEALPFAENEYDVIWSEGAIYNIGFERGLNEWRRYIKQGGYVAVTEASWLTDERPREIEKFWTDAYPEMNTVTHNIAVMQHCGYRIVAAFVLPDVCWTENFYAPQVEAQRIFWEKHRGNNTAMMLIDNQRREAEMYAKYHKYYGYLFYIGQKDCRH